MNFLKLGLLLLSVAAFSSAQAQTDKGTCDNSLEGLVVVVGQLQISALDFGTLKEMRIIGVPVSVQNHLPLAPVQQFVKSFGIYANVAPGLEFKNCRDGVYVISVGRGNAFPDCRGYESYISPRFVSFTCINE